MVASRGVLLTTMEQQLLEDVTDAVTRVFNALDAGSEDLTKTVRSLPWVLSPATTVQARTGDENLLSRTREALIRYVDSGTAADGACCRSMSTLCPAHAAR